MTATASGTEVTLSWSAVDGATSYTLYYGRTTGVAIANGTSISGLTDTSYKQANLTAGTTYYYIVTASHDGGESDPSSEVSATTLTTNPSALTVSPGNGKNRISWPAVDGATSYTLYHGTSSGVTTANGTAIKDITGTSYSHTGLTNNSTYYYILTATNSAGEATASSEVSGTPRKVQKMFLYVVTNTNIRPFSINMESGAVTAGTDATVPSGTTRLAVDPKGRFLYALAGTTIRCFMVDQSSGALTQVIDFTAPTIDMAVLPNGLYAYVTSNGKISRFVVNQATGALSSGSDLITGLGTVVAHIAIDPSGNYLYITDSDNNRLIPYSINTSAGLSSGAPATIAAGEVDLALAPSGNFIFEMSSGEGSDQIAPFSISSGSLTAGTVIGQGGSSGGQLLSVDGNGLFLYELSGSSPTTVYVHTINQTTGALGSATSVATTVTRITSEPTGRFFYTVSGTTLTAYTINASTGVLTSIGTASTASASVLTTIRTVVLGIPW